MFLRKRKAEWRVVPEFGGYCIRGKNAYALNIRQTFRDKNGQLPLITIYHGDNPIPYSGDTSMKAISDLVRNVDLERASGVSMRSISGKHILYLVLAGLFFVYYLGAFI